MTLNSQKKVPKILYTLTKKCICLLSINTHHLSICSLYFFKAIWDIFLYTYFLLKKECFSYKKRKWHFLDTVFFIRKKKYGFWVQSWWTSLLCKMGELSGEGSVAVAVDLGEMWYFFFFFFVFLCLVSPHVTRFNGPCMMRKVLAEDRGQQISYQIIKKKIIMFLQDLW